MRYLAFFMSFLLLALATSLPHAQEAEPAPSVVIMEQQAETEPFSLPVNPDLYLIRPGDELQITFVQSQLEPVKLKVNPEGHIVDKTFGSFDLSFKTLTQTREILGKALAKLYNIPGITISMVASRPVSINVTGAVMHPGIYTVFSSQRVSDVIEMAGGITSEGSRRLITFLGGPRPVKVDMDRAVFLGEYDMDPGAYAGQVIHVPTKSENTVQIAGEVRHPREIELVPGDDLQLLLLLAGGVRRYGDSTRIQIIRGSGSGSPDNLKGGDIIFVPPLPESPEGTFISVFGAVEKHGLIKYRDGMTLGDALGAVGGATADANIRHTTVFRRPRLDSGGRFTAERFPVLDPPGGGDNFTSLKLQPDDSVYVPVRVGYVNVAGAVRPRATSPSCREKKLSFIFKWPGAF